MVHESLEGGGSIAESKEHDSGFKKSHGCDKSSFPLILLLDSNVVVSPMNVEFSEQGRFLHVVDEFWDEGEGIGVLDGVGVQVVVILAWAKGSVLLWYKEERQGLGRFRGYNLSHLEVFFDKGSAHFHLHWVERVDLGNLGNEVWVKFNGVVIGTMGRKLIMDFL